MPDIITSILVGAFLSYVLYQIIQLAVSAAISENKPDLSDIATELREIRYKLGGVYGIEEIAKDLDKIKETFEGPYGIKSALKDIEDTVEAIRNNQT